MENFPYNIIYEQGNNKLKLDNITSIGLWVGLALIALCWIQVIPLLYGWIGFAIAVPSFIVEAINKKKCLLLRVMTIQGKLLTP